MRKLLYYTLFTLFTLFLFSCCEDEPSTVINKISGFTIYNESGESVVEYDYRYDSEGRLNYRSNPVFIDNIQYLNQNVSEWNIEYKMLSGEEIEAYYYNQDRLDSISNDYFNNFSGIDLVIFSYENNKCTSKTEIRNDEIINVYNFVYDNENIKEIYLEQKTQNDTLHYEYEYDESGNISSKFLNGIISGSFEYTNYKNPLYETSKFYLIKIPVHPNQSEKETITSKYLLSNAKYYNWDGVLEREILTEYTMNDIGLPVSAIQTTNGVQHEIKYEYK